MRLRISLRWIVLAGVGLTLLLGGCGGGSDPITTVTGQVVTAASLPLARATVQMGGVSATTNLMGHYRLVNVPPGEQTVTVTATGYTQAGSPITVTINLGANPLPPIVLTANSRTPPVVPGL